MLKVLATLTDRMDKDRSVAGATATTTVTVPPVQISGSVGSVQQQLSLVEIAIQGRGQAGPSLSGWAPR